MEIKTYTVMLSHSEDNLSAELETKIRKIKHAKFIGEIKENQLFFEIAEKTLPDVLIIDFDMLTFEDLNKLKELKSKYSHLNFIVISKPIPDVYLKTILTGMTDTIIDKPCDTEIVFTAVKNTIFSTVKGVSALAETDTENYSLNEFLQNKITETIRMAGIPAHIRGYNYIRNAILKCILDKDVFPITKKLYPQLANEFGSTSQKVECAIRHAIDVGWSRSEEKTMEDIFGYKFHNKRCKPTNREFIAMVADNIKIENSSLLETFSLIRH